VSLAAFAGACCGLALALLAKPHFTLTPSRQTMPQGRSVGYLCKTSQFWLLKTDYVGNLHLMRMHQIQSLDAHHT
jgi:hypothetical protein